jgi:surface polysaccharide O-acyltransferase-like enzyme
LVGIENSSGLSDFIRNLISESAARTAVPLFFLMSGYFLFLGFSWSIEDYKNKIKAHIKTLLIPFLFWNILTLSLFALGQYIPATQVYFTWEKTQIFTFGAYEYVNAIIGIDRFPVSYQFWFIRDLMVLVFLMPVIYLIIKIIPKIFFAGIFLLWFFNLWPVYIPSVEAFAFFYAGTYFAYSNTSLFALDRFGSAILSSYSVILLIDVFSKGYDFNNYIHNIGLLFGVASALYISKALVGINIVKNTLLWTAGCSFFVFAVHEPLLKIARKIIYKVISPSSDTIVLFLYFAIPILVIGLSILLYIIIKAISPRLLSIISGGRQYK